VFVYGDEKLFFIPGHTPSPPHCSSALNIIQLIIFDPLLQMIAHPWVIPLDFNYSFVLSDASFAELKYVHEFR